MSRFENCPVEGMSLRATSRLVDVNINTVAKLLMDIGRACEEFHNEMVQNVKAQRVPCDEIWSFVYSKAKNGREGKEDYTGDVWMWSAFDADSKLIVSWSVGQRDFLFRHFLINLHRLITINLAQFTL